MIGGEKMLKNRKGQSILEYVIVFTAIIAAIIVFAYNVLKPKVGSSLGHVATKMEEQVKKIGW